MTDHDATVASGPVPRPVYRAMLDALRLHASSTPEAPACVDLPSGRSWNYRQLDERVERGAAWLRGQLGHGSGARIAYLGRNSADIVVMLMACVRAGIVFVPLNWRLTEHELSRQIEEVQPQIFLYGTEFADTAQALVARVPGAVGLNAGRPGDALEAALDAVPASLCHQRQDDLDAADPVLFLFTSGTSGRSKAVVLTESNIFYSGVNLRATIDVDAQSCILCDVPLFHVLGLIAIVRTTLQAGGAILVSDGFQAADTLRRLMSPELGISHYFCVPQTAQLLRQEPDYAAAVFPKLRALITGGAPCPPTLIERWLIEKGVPLCNGFGMTEAGSVLQVPVSASREAMLAKSGSVGLRLMSIEARVVDEDGREVPAGGAGELLLRGPTITPGYWNRPEETARAFTADGWFRSGDAVRVDEDGHYWVLDRRKDMFISGGENVYPAEVEAALVELPDVTQAAVCGVPDERWGEVGCAWIVRAAGSGVDADQILEHCRTRLARYKVPKQILFADALPISPAGKIQKHILREQFRQAGERTG